MNTDVISQIVVALKTGRAAQAEQWSRAALLELPGNEDLLLLLAMSLQTQRRLPEAVSIHAELVRLFPANSVHWNNYATALGETGAMQDARAAYSKAVALDPANAQAKSQFGQLLIELREPLAAREMLLDALVLGHDIPETRIHAARACCLSQDLEGARELLAPWRSWTPLDDDGLQLSLAQVLTLRNDVLDAAELLEDLLSRQPENLEARLLLATQYERFNRLADAEAMAEPVLRAMAESTEAQRNEASHLLAALALRRGDAAAAKQMLERCGPQGEDDYAHYFQLAAVHDKLGETDAAMRALHVAHRLEAKERQFDSPEYFAPDAKALPLQTLGVSAEQYARWPRLIAPEGRDSPVFVVGFPRSGTTLLEQMLDAHPDLQSMDENPFFNRLADILRKHDPRILEDLGVLRQFDCDELRKRYYAMVDERVSRQPGVRVVDKNPLNMHWLPMIHRLFPEAKIILALRHPCDVVLSCYMQSFRSSSLAAACSTLERLAHAYVETMAKWIDEAALLQPSVMISRYEDLVADVALQTGRIGRFLDLADASPMLHFDSHARGKAYIATPSYSQVIEPVNRRGMARWHKYRSHFEPVLPILEPMLRHWGYSADAPA
ncbi:MAG: hypothetical protein BGP10_02450 [Rhodanobacter sp. 68-29]|nr:sulfotransferase [Rhodanobacter sp.]ODU74843.1 MAG: hypothetical protein ABT17_06255 [Rhodanobacter sp. SCN 69-32]OJY58505.1 MAG: hypothetical protein BGP10_02450 [Rhodanobacter sp. 68-29]